MANIDSKILLDLINEVTNVKNLFIKGDQFSSGFALCHLQRHIIELYKLAEQQEKEVARGNPPITP